MTPVFQKCFKNGFKDLKSEEAIANDVITEHMVKHLSEVFEGTRKGQE